MKIRLSRVIRVQRFFGSSYARVFQQIQELAGDRCIHCQAFSIKLVVPEEDNESIMKIRLSDANFKGEIQKRLDDFIQKAREE